MIRKTNEKATIIDGVVLTESAIIELLDWQKNENESLRIHLETLSDTICIIAKTQNEVSVNPEATGIMAALGFFRDDLKKLMKP